MDHQAFAQMLGNYGEFLGAIAVVVTLVYLAIQVRHSKVATEANTKSLNLQAYQTWQAANLQINLGLSNPAQSEIYMRGAGDSSNLTFETQVSFAQMNLTIFQMAQSADYQYRSGLLDEELWEAEMNRAAGLLAIPGVRQWWDAGGKTQITGRFAESLESVQTTMTYCVWHPGRGFVGIQEPANLASRLAEP
ncbi:MAG: hypothetical protein PVH91_04780 [Pseudomonadales bacterium]|jgi:hypothetical protein